MTAQFLSFAFPATGEPTSRTLPDRLADLVNVKDYGAVGDGVTDDWAAIMAAFNHTASPNRGTIFFPPGNYIVSQPIDFSGANINASFIGVLGASTVTGNFANYVFKREEIGGTDGYSGCHSVENLTIINMSASGGGIRIGECVGAAVRNCVVIANQGINTANDDVTPGTASLEVAIQNCTLSPGSNTSGSLGINTVANGPIFSCSVTGFDTGMKVRGQEGAVSIKGCRFELCKVGLLSAGGIVSGCLFKNCGIALEGGAGSIFSGLRIEGAIGTIAGDPQYGIKLAADSFGRSTFKGIIVTGQFQQYGIFIAGGESFTLLATFIGVQSTNSGGLGAWHLPSTAGTVQLIGCNVAPVFTMAGLPAFASPIRSLSWSAGTTTLTQGFVNLSPYISQSVSVQVTVEGASPVAFNGTFSGTTATGVLTMTYAQTNPGSPTGSGGMVIINPAQNGVASTLEGDCFNVSDANTATWGANPLGGGKTHAKVRWNGSNWTAVGI